MDFEITSEIVETLGVLSESGTWKKEVNIVQWGESIAKYDIRSWNKDHSRAGKGISLSLQEIKELKKILNKLEI